MAVLRPHLALTVTDVERSIPFYEALFGTTPEKVKPGYAKFSVAEPALNFTLNQGERSELGAFNHAGIQVAAKTGTAQNGVNNTGLDDAVFTGFAPYGNPDIAVGVVVKGGGLGADASAPVAVQIIKAYMNSLRSSAK